MGNINKIVDGNKSKRDNIIDGKYRIVYRSILRANFRTFAGVVYAGTRKCIANNKNIVYGANISSGHKNSRVVSPAQLILYYAL